jgi:anti-anti-sigma regulatory factor
MSNTAYHEDNGIIVLPELLDLTAAEPLHRTLLDRAHNGDPPVLTGAAVERVSTAVVQVLLAAAADARSRGTTLQLRDPSAALTDAFADLGVGPDFGF